MTIVLLYQVQSTAETKYHLISRNLMNRAWFVGTWAVPRDFDTNYLHGTNHGTHATCAVQGFFVQFGGFSSLLFNASLAVVLLLTRKETWTVQRIRNFVGRLQIVLWIVSLATAITPAVLDMYHYAGPLCWISHDPFNCTETWLLPSSDMETDCIAGDNSTIMSLALQTIPLWACILSDAILMCIICRMMKTVERKHITNIIATAQELSTIEEQVEGQVQDQHQSCDAEEEISEKDDIDNDKNNDENPFKSVTSLQSAVRYSQRRTQLVAKQGIWYIAGFLLTYGFFTVSMVIYFATGDWCAPFDRAGYFFIALQGVWNFLIFSRPRDMKTRMGKATRYFVWELLWGCRPLRRCLSSRATQERASASQEANSAELSVALEDNAQSSVSWMLGRTSRCRRSRELISELGNSGITFAGDYACPPLGSHRQLLSEGDASPPTHRRHHHHQTSSKLVHESEGKTLRDKNPAREVSEGEAPAEKPLR